GSLSRAALEDARRAADDRRRRRVSLRHDRARRRRHRPRCRRGRARARRAQGGEGPRGHAAAVRRARGRGLSQRRCRSRDGGSVGAAVERRPVAGAGTHGAGIGSADRPAVPGAARGGRGSRRAFPGPARAGDPRQRAALGKLAGEFQTRAFGPEPLRALVTPEQARQRWAALREFARTHGHWLVTAGPYVLGKLTPESVSLVVFRDFTYPLGVGSFDQYPIPLRAFVVKTDRRGDKLELQADVENIEKAARSYKIVR